MPIKPWEILNSRHILPKFRIDTCQLPDGQIFKPFVLEFDSWANVLAITKKNEAVLVRQYRHGVRESLLELPGGVVNEGEDPLEGVKRELLEETGFAAQNFVEVGKIYPNPAIQQNTLYCYFATDAEKVGEQNLDKTEDIEVHLVPLDELVLMAGNGSFIHALHVAILFRVLAYMGRIK